MNFLPLFLVLADAPEKNPLASLMTMSVIVPVALALLVLIVIAKTAVVVPQQSAYVVERLGRYAGTLGAGFHFLFPFIDVLRYRLSLKEQALDIPEQVCITRDNVQVGVDGVIYLKVMNPERASYGVQDYFFAISQLAQTTLRSEVGKIDLDRTFEERSHINGQVVSELDKASEPWGVKVLRYEIKNIVPPKDVLSAMEKQMRAEREKRAVILTSEGERDARINEAEGEKQQVIKASEATRQRQINEAEGQAAGDPRGRERHRRRAAPGRRDDPERRRSRGGAAARRRAVGRPVRATWRSHEHRHRPGAGRRCRGDDRHRDERLRRDQAEGLNRGRRFPAAATPLLSQRRVADEVVARRLGVAHPFSDRLVETGLPVGPAGEERLGGGRVAGELQGDRLLEQARDRRGVLLVVDLEEAVGGRRQQPLVEEPVELHQLHELVRLVAARPVVVQDAQDAAGAHRREAFGRRESARRRASASRTARPGRTSSPRPRRPSLASAGSSSRPSRVHSGPR